MSRESIVEWADGTTGKVTFSDYGIFSDAVPANPAMQRIAAEIIAQKEAEINTPENRQKAFEAEVAERESKKIDFHFRRAIPRFLGEGWKHLREELVDEEIRVYTTNNQGRRFWGIKPAGMGMLDFWEQNDPEIGRYEDNVAVTWANPLIPPPVSTFDEDHPDIWAGQGPNPDLPPPEPLIAKAPPPIKAAGRPKRRQTTPEVNPARRVRKSASLSPRIDKNTRKTSADRDLAPLKRLRGRPAGNAKLASKNDISLPKRPRGRPAAVKAQPAATSKEALPSKRPRGRPRKSTDTPSKQKKTPTVKGSRVTKPSQTARRQAPSTHKMRTRGEGPAELIQLP